MRLIAALVLVSLAVTAHAAPRSHQARAEFKWEQPCPATGRTRGPCPGWVIDHVEPLCAGGADHPLNMQWQAREEAAQKDKHERRQCRNLKGDR